MKNLFKLNWRIFVNREFTDKDTSRFSASMIIGLLFMVFLSLLMGITMGFTFVNYDLFGDAQFNKTDFVNLNLSVWFLIIILVKVFSPKKILSGLEIKKIKYLPLKLYEIFTADLIMGLLDRWYIMPFGMMIGLFAIIGAFSISLIFSFSILLGILLNILVLHIVSETFMIITGIIIGDFKKIIFTVLVVIILSFLYLQNIDYNSLISFMPPVLLFQNILDNSAGNSGITLPTLLIIYLSIILTGIAAYYILRWYEFNKLTENLQNPKKNSAENYSFRSLSFIRNISLKKEIILIFLSTRSRSVFLGEIILVIFFLFYHKDFNLFIAQIICAVMIGWFGYLSVCWGYDKAGFGTYLFTPIKIKQQILAKNLIFFLVRIPIVVIYLLMTAFLFSSEYLAVAFLLIITTMFITTICSNFFSMYEIKPVETKEPAIKMNTNFKVKFNLIPFALVAFQFIILLIMIFVFYTFRTSAVTYSIYIAVFIIAILIYYPTLKKAEKVFQERKEIIYKELT
ncbi:MAG: hypothetical protein GXX85_13775 [Ignavibacteria bacterium]|nr:hypothetical protein [Ignavibacteria bacterium]